jgi:hypothetical protein
MRFRGKKSSQILITHIILASVLLTSSFVSTITFIHNAAYAQSSNTGFGSTAYLALTNGKTIQIPREIVDNKKEGNADAPFRVHVDGKDATFKETANDKTTRTLSIQFSKDAKVIDIIGSTSTVQ